MRTTPLPLSAALLALVLASSGCTDETKSPYFGVAERRDKDPATFYINSGGEPEYLDPGKSADGLSGALVLQLFEGLSAFDPRDMHPVQGVATSWDQTSDNRLFRFHLRSTASWSDGAPVTASDFAYAWTRVLDSRTRSRSAAHLFVLKNGELFHTGKLKVLRDKAALLDAPREGAGVVAELAEGRALRILARDDAEKPFVRVELYEDLPRFQEAPVISEAAPRASGYIDETKLVSDARVVGVRAKDEHTLEVELEQPTPFFIELTSYPTLFPVRKDVVERFEKEGDPDAWVRPENIVTNGPYVLDEWKFRSEITMKQNPYYWNKDQLKIHKIVWLEIEDYHSTMNLYKTGEVDSIGDNLGLPAEYIPMLETKKDFLRHDYLSVYWYDFNTRVPPLDNPRVRRALDLAIDKRELIEKVTHGGQKFATHYVPDFTGGGYSAEVQTERARKADRFAGPEHEFNPERARALLGEAGYEIQQESDGYRAKGVPPLEILYNTGEGHRMLAIAIQDMWKRHLGVSVTLRCEEWKVMLKNARDGNYQIVRSGWTADYNHPHTFLEQFLSTSPQNQTGYADPAFDEALHKAAMAADRAVSMRLYREAEEIAVRAMPRLPIFFYTRSTLVKPWVKGFWPSSRNMHLIQFMWIDPDHKARTFNEPAYPPPEFWPHGRYSR